MNRRNARKNWTRDRAVRPIVYQHAQSGFHDDARTRRSLRVVWHWSQTLLHQVAVFAWKLTHRPQPRLEFCSGSRCVKGPVRESNEDRCYADGRRGLFVVADGMGGHAGGEQASQTVIEVVAAQLSEVLDNERASQAEIAEAMLTAVSRANRELTALAQIDVSLRGMGATAVMGVVYRGQLLLCSVGDSRAYLLRHDELRQLTDDDTLVQGLVRAGALTDGEAERHPMRHVLLHCVGTRKLEKVLQVESHRLLPGDRVLFTSDGLTDVVGSGELAKLLASESDPHAAAATLVGHAHEAGARDNITCIVVNVSCDRRGVL